MKYRDYAALFLLGLVACLAVAAFQRTPGYMDADYYTLTGARLAGRLGFTENFLWNYLDEPAGLPHPSHAYWMPLASLLAALGIRLGGASGFNLEVFGAARLPFLLLAGFIPPLTARLSFTFYPRRSAGWLSGLLAVFSGFYLRFLPTTDTFALGMLLGAVWFLIAAIKTNEIYSPLPVSGRGGRGVRSFTSLFLLGLLSGLFHLSRADGVLWLLPGFLLVCFWSGQECSSRTALLSRLLPVSLLFLGYLVVMAPWLARNQAVFGSLLPPGSSRALWLLEYDDLYIFPAALLTPARWAASGLREILSARAFALGQNLQTALAVQGMVFAGPLALAGAWRLRRLPAIRLGALMWVLILVVMTLVFPFAGGRGGFFHSGAPLQPLIWALVPLGLESLISWGARRRNWRPGQAWRVLGAGLASLAVLLSLLVLSARGSGSDNSTAQWGQGEAVYASLEPYLVELGIPKEARVLVNNPPGFTLVTGRASLAVPAGGLDMLQAAAQRYGAQYLLLEANHPQDLAQLFAEPSDQPGLDYLGTFAGVQVYRIEGDPR